MKPPVWIDNLLKRLLPVELREELLGDLHEQFALQSEAHGKQKARLLYVLEVLRFCRPYYLKRRFNSPSDTHYSTSYTNASTLLKISLPCKTLRTLLHK